jgi:uncharacterized protein (TIGR02266 family)
MEVEYRTSTAFLIAYSLNLSKGGLFLESDTPLPAGTTLKLRFQIAGSSHPIETDGAVIWVRDTATPDGPAGMGIAFVQLEPRYGAVIDGIVTRFDGVTMVVASTLVANRSVVARYLRGMMSCQVYEVSTASEPASLPPDADRVDLAVVDFAQSADQAEKLAARLRQTVPDIPIIGLAAPSDPGARRRAAAAGAFEVLPSPPPYNELYRAVLNAFSRLVKLRQL